MIYFRRHLNVLMDGASLTDSGMAFQMLGDECGVFLNLVSRKIQFCIIACMCVQ